VRELKIIVAVETERLTQEVVDKLLDGTIKLAGNLKSVVVEEGKGRVDYTPEVL